MEHLESFIKDCDRKIQIAKKRLEETQDDHQHVPEVGVCFMVLNYRVKNCLSVLSSFSQSKRSWALQCMLLRGHFLVNLLSYFSS